MEFLILESFIKSVPKEKKEEFSNCMKKLSKFKIEDIQKGNIPSGYKIEEIKSIKNRNIYKLRTNRENRVLFTYGKYIDGVREEHINSLVLLSYSNHDNQIKKASRFNLEGKKVIKLDELEDYVDYTEKNLKQIVNKDLELSVDNMISIIADDDYVDRIFSDKKLSKIYYLDDVQKNAADHDENGKMLFGSAGSGKTTISLYRIIKLLMSNPDMKICYITYSNVLKKNTKDNFEVIAKNLMKFTDEDIKNVSFYTLEEYMIKKCNVKAIANFESFNNWYEENIKKYSDIDIPPIKIWREIRGVLTGIIGKDLFNNIEISNEVLECIWDKKFRSAMDEFIQYNANETFCIKQGKSIAEFKSTVSRIDTMAAHKIYSNLLSSYISHLKENKILNKDDYKKLTKFTSIECNIDRIKIYDIAMRYFEYIDTNDNEAFSNFEAINNIKSNIAEYDYLIIDEMQDLTERELFYLMTGVKDKRRILFTGDFNQTINPTYFDAGRVEGIYRLYAGFDSLDKSDCISRNYRSVDKVVNLSNVIVEKRNKIFVNRRREFEYIEESVRVGEKEVLYIEGNKLNKDRVMEAIKADYSSIIIVSDNKSKDALIKKYPFIDDRIYTVSESKGIESKKVILYNIISDEKDIWAELFKQSKVTDDSLRYYFNSLYVSITRAREELIFIEEKENVVFDLIKEKVINIKEFDANAEIVVSSNEEILDEAIKKENEEFYDHAIKIYTKLLETEHKKQAEISIKRCKLLEGLEKTKDTRGTINSLIDLNELDLAKEKAMSFNIADLYLKALLMNSKNITPAKLDEELQKKFSLTVPKVLEADQEIDYCDLVLEKYYSLNLGKLDGLITETKKITNNLKVRF